MAKNRLKRTVIVEAESQGRTALIKLAKGLGYAVIDGEDAGWAGQYNWHRRESGYIMRGERYKDDAGRDRFRTVMLHKEVVQRRGLDYNRKRGMFKNGDRSDCRLENLDCV